MPKEETARVRTQGHWKKVVKVGTSVLLKYPARERTREPQFKGGGFRKSGKKRSGKRRRNRRNKLSTEEVFGGQSAKHN